VVDALSGTDYREAHTSGSTNVPFPEVNERFPEGSDRDREIVVY
jgi:rhodanese-related sulfurtransferase